MKRICFFILTVLASISLMGQSGKNNLQKDNPIFKNIKGEHYKRFLLHSGTSQLNDLKSSNDLKHQLDSTWDENFSSDPDLWTKSGKEEFFYNNDKKLASYLWFEYDEIDNLWIEEYKEEVSYDENGNLSEVEISYFNTETDEWAVSEKIEFTYDDGGNLMLMSDFEWDIDWVLYGTVEYFYNSNGVLDRIIYYNDEKEEFTYNVNGTLSELNYYYYEADVWKKGSKEEYDYNSNDQVISTDGYYWNSDMSEWINFSRNEYSYDANGNPVEEINLDNSGLGNEITAQRKCEYNYDIDYNLSNIIIPSLELFYPDFSEEIVNKPLNYIVHYPDESSSGWFISSRTTYYYSDQEVSNGFISNTNEASVFPNPASEYIDVSSINYTPSAIFELFDMQAKKLSSQIIPQSGKVSVAHLSDGLYIYKLIDDKRVYSGKILVEK
ncbi:MAG: T9SS type A sorting domain-containing protein [Bacteroidales bacterium]|nr:T9SS type A sorting domain-containing protein [Bacteroidales bacterium]MCF8390021.1 T9SS type A sorting domain-containing protein [Bacteroidales bacterium]